MTKVANIKRNALPGLVTSGLKKWQSEGEQREAGQQGYRENILKGR